MGDTRKMTTRVMIVENDIFIRTILGSAMKNLGYEVVIQDLKPWLGISKAKAMKAEAALIDLNVGQDSTIIDLALALRMYNPKIGLVLLAEAQDPRLEDPDLPPWPKGTVYLSKRAVVDIDSLQFALEQSLDHEGNEGYESKEATSTEPVLGKLTIGQIETLRLISKGLSNSAIAEQGFVKERSIEQTISRIAKALSVRAGPGDNQRVRLARIYFRARGAKAGDGKSESS
jgi:DNA-binding NarL/FixJ family response regulator|tara:strand:- start:131 stop:820 length:690 start_codon:yes stop_codon:yes gene_type:complete